MAVLFMKSLLCAGGTSQKLFEIYHRMEGLAKEFSTDALPMEGTSPIISLILILPIFLPTALRTSSTAGSFSSNRSTLFSKSRYMGISFCYGGSAHLKDVDDQVEFMPMLCQANSTHVAEEYAKDPETYEFQMEYGQLQCC